LSIQLSYKQTVKDQGWTVALFIGLLNLNSLLSQFFSTLIIIRTTRTKV